MDTNFKVVVDKLVKQARKEYSRLYGNEFSSEDADLSSAVFGEGGHSRGDMDFMKALKEGPWDKDKITAKGSRFGNLFSRKTDDYNKGIATVLEDLKRYRDKDSEYFHQRFGLQKEIEDESADGGFYKYNNLNIEEDIMKFSKQELTKIGAAILLIANEGMEKKAAIGAEGTTKDTSLFKQATIIELIGRGAVTEILQKRAAQNPEQEMWIDPAKFVEMFPQYAKQIEGLPYEYQQTAMQNIAMKEVGGVPQEPKPQETSGFDQFAEGFDKNVGGALTSMNNSVKSGVKNIKDTIKGVTDSTGSYLSSILGGEDAGETNDVDIEGIKREYPEIRQMIENLPPKYQGRAIVNFFNKKYPGQKFTEADLPKVLKEVPEEAPNTFDNFAKGFDETAKSGINAARDTFGNAGNVLKDWFSDPGKNVSKMVGVAGDAADAVGKGVDYSKDVYDAADEMYGPTISSGVDKAKDLASRGVDYSKDVYDAADEMYGPTIDKGLDILKDWVTDPAKNIDRYRSIGRDVAAAHSSDKKFKPIPMPKPKADPFLGGQSMIDDPTSATATTYDDTLDSVYGKAQTKGLSTEALANLAEIERQPEYDFGQYMTNLVGKLNSDDSPGFLDAIGAKDFYADAYDKASDYAGDVYNEASNLYGPTLSKGMDIYDDVASAAGSYGGDLKNMISSYLK